ncbi:MAG: Spy/CpxP family protein refolding chaperone [Candidatus Eisenbacteria bacterium]|nr:Spy/CpxP family protein refolding chaperone [Candidatus Eisenbacteria bacterium]
MRTNRMLALVALALVVTATLAFALPAQARGRAGWGGPCGMQPGMAGGAPMRPAFTAEQTEKIEKIRAKYDDLRVEHRNKIAAIRLEMRDLLSQPEPDFGKVEAKIDAMSQIHAKLAKLRLAQHKEVRGLLDAEQRMLFDRGFTERLGEMPGPCMGRQAMAGCRPGGMMGGPCPMAGEPGAGRGVRPQSGQWRRWL